MRWLTSFLITLLLTQISAGQELSDTLKASYSLPEGRVKEIVRNAAKDFSRRHARNSISLIRYQRTVKSSGHYCNLIMETGLAGYFGFTQKVDNPLNDPGFIGYLPMNSFMSLFRKPGSDSYCDVPIVNNPDLKGLDAYRINYNTISQIPDITARLRAMETNGPLNPAKLRYYEFSLESYSNQLKTYTIRFTSKDGAFPKHIRLSGEGLLFISLENGINGFKLLDTEDRFSLFIKNDSPNRSESVTNYTFEARYIIDKGHITLDHITQEVQWVNPQVKDKKWYYQAETSPFKSPFDAGLKTFTRIDFSNNLFFSDDEAAKYSSKFRSGISHCIVDDDNTYPSPDPSKVRNASSIKKDLEILGISMDDQSSMEKELYKGYYKSIRNGQSLIDYQTEKVKNARALYLTLYAARKKGQ